MELTNNIKSSDVVDKSLGITEGRSKELNELIKISLDEPQISDAMIMIIIGSRVPEEVAYCCYRLGRILEINTNPISMLDHMFRELK